MLDKVEIQETISRYHEAGSRSDWDQILSTFLPDAVWEVPSLQVRAEGHAGIRETMSSLVAGLEYLVQINAPAIIGVDGDDATARSMVRECARFGDGGPYLDVVGRFDDELRRTADGWKFSRRTFTLVGSHVTQGDR